MNSISKGKGDLREDQQKPFTACPTKNRRLASSQIKSLYDSAEKMPPVNSACFGNVSQNHF